MTTTTGSIKSVREVAVQDEKDTPVGCPNIPTGTPASKNFWGCPCQVQTGMWLDGHPDFT